DDQGGLCLQFGSPGVQYQEPGFGRRPQLLSASAAERCPAQSLSSPLPEPIRRPVEPRTLGFHHPCSWPPPTRQRYPLRRRRPFTKLTPSTIDQLHYLGSRCHRLGDLH